MNEMISDTIALMEMDFEKAVNHFRDEMNNTRAGRANPHLLDKIVVDYYGQATPINQMANITVPEARILAISVWDQSAVKNVVKAIQTSDLGLNPSDDGKIIRISFPQLTEERRKDLVKTIQRTAEDSRVTIRNMRRDALEEMKKAKKDSLITEDEMAGAEKDVQKSTDKAIAEIDSVLEAKKKELMEV